MPFYEAHPIRQFVIHGVPVTLNTDFPVHLATTLDREYAIAAALGFAPTELLGLTRNAIRASLATAQRRQTVLAELDAWGPHCRCMNGAAGPSMG